MHPSTRRQLLSSCRSLADIARFAWAEGEATEVAYKAIEAWTNDRDDEGRLIRPWAHCAGNPADNPNYLALIVRLAGMFNDPAFAALSLPQKLSVVDRGMMTDWNRITAH